MNENIPLLSENCEDRNMSNEESHFAIDDIPEDRKNRWKISPKWSIIISCSTWGFLTGVERAIILPTLWLYFTNKFGNDTAQTYYGITLASFNLSVFLVAPIYGLMAIKGFRTKFLLIVSNQMEIVGNIIYFVGSEPWMILLGRFISGIGSGSEVPLYADVVRMTNSKERTFFIIILLLARQLGLVIGPAATLIFHPLQFMIWNITLNIYNCPGFLMAILWSIQTVLVLILYPDVSKNGDVIDDSRVNMRLEQRLIRKVYNKDESTDENKNLEISLKIDKIIVKCRSYSNYVTCTLLFIVFVSYFCLMCLEAVLPPILIRYFQWTEVQNSWIYLVAGVLVIIIYGILQKVTQYVKDRTIFSVGLLFLIVSYSWMSITLAFIDSSRSILHIVLVIIAIFFHVLGLSLVVACGESLFTKVLPIEEMDLAQSVLRTVINFSFLIGPYVGGSLPSYGYVVFLIMLVIVILSSFLVSNRYANFDIK